MSRSLLCCESTHLTVLFQHGCSPAVCERLKTRENVVILHLQAQCFCTLPISCYSASSCAVWVVCVSLFLIQFFCCFFFWGGRGSVSVQFVPSMVHAICHVVPVYKVIKCVTNDASFLFSLSRAWYMPCSSSYMITRCFTTIMLRFVFSLFPV